MAKKIPEKHRKAQERTERMQALVGPAKAGDETAIGELWLLYNEMALPIAQNYVNKYPFVDRDDLQQGCSLYFRKVLERYDPYNSANNCFSKYCYHRIFFICKDLLRQRDDLGIKWPQKLQYPEWCHLEAIGMSDDGQPYDAADDNTVEPIAALIAAEEQSIADDLADLKAAAAPSKPKYDAEVRAAASRKAAETRKKNLEKKKYNEARAAKREAKRQAEAAKPVPQASPSLVDVSHLRAAKALVLACGDADRARAALDAFLSI